MDIDKTATLPCRWLAIMTLVSTMLLTACALASGPTPVPLSTIAPAVTPLPSASVAPTLATAQTPTAGSTAGPIVIDSLQDLRAVVRRIATAEPASAQALASELWQELASSQRVPLILGDQVVFLYKGEAQQVSWRGAFNSWSAPGLEGARVGQTDLWIGQLALPVASRVEYKIVLNDKDWIVDPVNPNLQVSDTGTNNVVVMPGFTVTDEGQRRPGVASGTLTEGLSITSRSLGYTINYWVYTPVGYEHLTRLPVLYVLDGDGFVDERMGALPIVLDNLIAGGRIRPVLAVFVDAREPGSPQHNRREDEFLAHPVEHARFIAEELVPAIDRAYHTDPRPEARVIVGVSYGGLSATYIAATQTGVFHNLAAFSPAFGVLQDQSYLTDPRKIGGARLMWPPIQAATECGGDTGFACPRLPLKVFVSTGWPSWDVGDFNSLAATLRQQGYLVEFHQVREAHTWSQWRGLSDEMLTYFFGGS